MQTFLPYRDFRKSAEALDRQRLGKQRVEGEQILDTLLTGGRWANHPAVRMWRGYEGSLSRYVFAVCLEWQSRGYRDSILDRLPSIDGPDPDWLGDERLHSSHRAALLFKSFDYYSKFGWQDWPQIDYWWPK